MTESPEAAQSVEASEPDPATQSVAATEPVASTEPVAETEPPELDPAHQDESGWFRTHRASPFISGGVTLLIILALIYRTVFTEVRNDTLDIRVLAVAGLIGAAIIGAVVLFSFIFWRTTYFKVTESYLFRRSGSRNKETVQIELSTVDGADLKRGIFARMLGLAELNIRPGSGDSIAITYLPLEQCKELRAQILHVQAPPNSSAEAPSKASYSTVAAHHRGTQDGGEEKLYTLPRARQLWALAYGTLYAIVPVLVFLLVAVLTALAIFDLPADFWVWPPEDVSPASLLMSVLLGLVAGAVGLTKLVSKHYKSTLTLNRGKLTTQRGLTTDVASTITLTKVNWVEINQPFSWRRAGWWRLRVRSLTSMEEESDSDDGENSSEILAPVATSSELTALLGLLEPQSHVPAGHVLAVARRETPLDLASSPRARIFNPFTHGRNGAVITDSALLVRTGRFATKITVIPFTKIQGCTLDQGPLQRPRKLGNVTIHGAREVKDCTVVNLDSAEATMLFERLIAATRSQAYKP